MKPLLLFLLFITITSEIALDPERGLGQTGSNKGSPPPFSISISAVPHVVKVGQRLVINIVLTNLSDHSLDTPSAWMGSLDAVYAFDIRDSTGTQLTPHAPPTVGYLVGVAGTLDPGKAKGEDVRIDDFYNLAKPGTYEIQVKRCIDLENPEGGLAPKYDETKGVVMSNKITITVVPATTAAPR